MTVARNSQFLSVFQLEMTPYQREDRRGTAIDRSHSRVSIDRVKQGVDLSNPLFTKPNCFSATWMSVAWAQVHDGNGLPF